MRAVRAVLPELAIALIGLALSIPAAFASPGSILVYAGNGALYEGYTKFGVAAGKPVVTSPVLPADLSRRQTTARRPAIRNDPQLPS